MFGKNKILKIVQDNEGKLDVHSIFATIQGEGPFAGRPAIFVRLHGCSLACSWCDTEFESVQTTYGPQELLDKINEVAEQEHMTDPLIVVTGGEPMRQNLVPFLTIAAKDADVQIETAGIHWQDGLTELLESSVPVYFVVSPKTHKVQPEFEVWASAFKYIVSMDDVLADDGLPKMAVSQRGQPATATLYRAPSTRLIYVQPLDSGDADKNRHNLKFCVAIAMRNGYMLSIQQHKIIGMP